MLSRCTAGLALVAAAMFLACRRAPTPDLAAAEREVAAADRAWAAAAAAHDLDASVNAMAADGMMLPPGQPPVVGRAAIRAYMAAAFAIPGFRIEWAPGEIHVAGSGELAYAYGQSRYTVPDSAGTPHTMPSRGMTVWRRESDGRWRCVADIWNDAPAPPPTAGAAM